MNQPLEYCVFLHNLLQTSLKKLTSKLDWDPGRMFWSDSKEFLKYSSKQGRELLQQHTRVPNVVGRKWRGVLPDNYKLRWDNVWDTERMRIAQEIDQSCSVCLRGTKETVMHGFWECPAARRAWNWCKVIINLMVPAGEGRGNHLLAANTHTDSGAGSSHAASHVVCINEVATRNNRATGRGQGPWLQKLTINWKQGIFRHRLPNRFKLVSRVWLLICGVVIWHIWEQCNEAAFDGRHWHPAKLYHKLWLSMIDYGRLSWSRVQGKLEKTTNNIEKLRKIINNFQSNWCRKSLFAVSAADHPQWNLLGPRYDSFT